MNWEGQQEEGTEMPRDSEEGRITNGMERLQGQGLS